MTLVYYTGTLGEETMTTWQQTASGLRLNVIVLPISRQRLGWK